MNKNILFKILQLDSLITVSYTHLDVYKRQELQKRTGITPEKLIEAQELDIKFKGFAPKKQAVIVDAEEDILNRF